MIDHALRRCRLPAQLITGEMIDVALDLLYLMLSEWANRNIQCWCIEKLILPLYEAQAQLPVPLGTVDILNANLRVTFQQTGNETLANNVYTCAFSNPTQVTTIGLLWTGNAQPINFQVSNDGQTFTTTATASPNATAGQKTWHDIDAAQFYPYFRITTVSGGILNLSLGNVFLSNTPYEITIARLNRDDYFNLPNKTFQGRPLQYWYDRQRDIPYMTLWPVPSVAFVNQQISVLRKRYIMDITRDTSQTVDVPQRWYEAVVANLAARIADEIPEVKPDMMAILVPKAEMALRLAQAEERDNSPIYMSPNISMYTR